MSLPQLPPLGHNALISKDLGEDFDILLSCLATRDDFVAFDFFFLDYIILKIIFEITQRPGDLCISFSLKHCIFVIVFSYFCIIVNGIAQNQEVCSLRSFICVGCRRSSGIIIHNETRTNANNVRYGASELKSFVSKRNKSIFEETTNQAVHST